MTTQDTLLPSREVWTRYGVCDRTLDRWVADPALGFPAPLRINRRRYWRAADLQTWERGRGTRSAL